LLDCWIAGLLDCWIAGLLDCWIAGLLDLKIKFLDKAASDKNIESCCPWLAGAEQFNGFEKNEDLNQFCGNKDHFTDNSKDHSEEKQCCADLQEPRYFGASSYMRFKSSQ
jgi:hypothetical protein